MASPLYDIYDPYGVIRQQAEYGALGDPRNARLSDLMPQEQQDSMLRSLANKSASGLSALGWLLDTPGSVVRGTLSGGPLKGISALWESSDDRVTGRELLRQYGMAGEGDSWGNFFGGLGAEVLLDPLSYASLGLSSLVGKGAETAAGKAVADRGLLSNLSTLARSQGVGPREFLRKNTAQDILSGITDAAKRADAEKALQRLGVDMSQPLARSNRVGFPFMGETAVDLYGERAGDLIAKAGDFAGEALRLNPYTGAVADWAARAFDPSVMDMRTYERQMEARPIYEATQAELASVRESLARAEKSAVEGLAKYGYNLGDPYVNDNFRRLFTLGYESIDPEFSRAINDPGVNEYVNFWEQLRDSWKTKADELGISAQEFNSRAGTQFFPQQQVWFDVERQPDWPAGKAPPRRQRRDYGRRARAFELGTNLGRQRNDYMDVLGGAYTVNRMSGDAALQQALRESTPDQAEQIIREWAGRTFDRDSPVLLPNRSDDLFAWVDERQNMDSIFDDSPMATQRQQLVDKYEDAIRDAQENARKFNLPTDGVTSKRADALAAKISQLEADMMAAAESGPYVHKARPLPKDHPLVVAENDLAKKQAAAAAGGETSNARAFSKQLSAVRKEIEQAERKEYRKYLYSRLGDVVRQMDPQHAEKGVPFFGRNVFNEMAQYALNVGRVRSQADGMLDLLTKNAVEMAPGSVTGGTNYGVTDALKQLGFDDKTGPAALAKRMDVLPEQLGSYSFDKNFIDEWSRQIQRGSAPELISPLLQKYDDFTKSFKTLGLLFPSRYTRDYYSGGFAAASKGGFNLSDQYAALEARKGNYGPLAKRLENAPDFEGLTPEQRIDKALMEMARVDLSVSTQLSDSPTDAAGVALRGMYPGAAPNQPGSLLRRFYNPDRSWREGLENNLNIFAVRGADGNRNPILEAGDRVAEFTDAANRIGSYITYRRKGIAPEEAKRLTDLTQVNYKNATDFENRYLKRLIPFYSYTRGIVPYIGDQVLNEPYGFLGLSTRAINRASQPSEDNFVREDLRRSAAIPVPEGTPILGSPGEGFRRYLTNIDLPFAGTVNLFSPGTGNNILSQLGNTVKDTAVNILGSTNPLIKSPLELATNRQFYSGRQLSDLYSMFEQSLGEPGRFLEQVGYNVPGGSRALGVARQLMDDRMSISDRLSKLAFNSLTGLKVTDVDIERTRRQAARNMLNDLLKATPGVRTYENITVPEETLAKMPEEQRNMYLLYKIIQAEAARKARERKKAEEAANPVAAFNL